MENQPVYKNKEAINFLISMFEKMKADTPLTVLLSSAAGRIQMVGIRSNVSISGFSEQNRKKTGNLGKLAKKKGSVLFYGDKQPDFCLIVKHNGKANVFVLNEFTVTRTGVAGSVLHINSTKWKRAKTIDIYLSNHFSGDNVVAFFTQYLIPKINDGEMISRTGKWVSKKVFDRDLDRDEAERRSIAHAAEKPEEESIRTMVIGGNIEKIEYISNTAGKDEFNVIKVYQQSFPTSLEFKEMMIEFDTFGKEIGARQAESSYVYLIGTHFRAPSNLIIIRHRKREE